MLVGRERELQFLQEKYDAEGSQMLVVYGRRRVGKTTTLSAFCRRKPRVFFSAAEATDRAQLARFSQAILREGVPASRYVSTFAGWEDALGAIGDLPYGEAKKLVVIDEFPRICEQNKAVPSILQRLWDTRLRRQNVMIVLCGSSLSFIEKDLLAGKSPLYGRATGIWKMEAMGFYDAVRFFPEYSSLDKVLAYAVLGGVPRYLRQWDPGLSVEANIKRNILTKGSLLYDEAEFLLRQELRETRIYNVVIEAVALGSERLSEIDRKSMILNPSKTSVYLRNLTELGIVEREFPLEIEGEPGKKAASARGLYRLTDNFLRFWYAFGFPNYSQLEAGDAEGAYRYLVAPRLHGFASRPFEDICRQFVTRLQRDGLLPFHYSRMGRWWGKTTVRDPGKPEGLRIGETEIDILAAGPGDKEYLAGECKFKDSPFTRAEFLSAAAKLAPQLKQPAFHYALFSKSGFEDSLRKEAEGSRVRLYDLDDIVNYQLAT